ncbi:MAG: hypothetical protein QOK82_01185 [Nitrososphaeraceae archaeon]|jgi:hypothetical protein|nr:hypothetical protein [Nitrososphaeraceae archaeon]MDW0127877.1 hypothetical protein [Nitrososphaeraceae archaeon]MDW0141709.1 hypothetical protein [Nitrososphaeraceae archaeon]MDW3654786.1 hypothetical protein [Nitrososphaeraceae archaeon]
MILITEIKLPVLDGILNYFRLKEIVIEDKVAKWLAIGIAGRASGALSLKLFAA